MGNIEEKDEEKEKLYGIEISKEAKKELDLIKKSGTPSVKKKLERIIEELQKHPTEGVGIEQLKGKGGIGQWKPNLHAHMVFDFTNEKGKNLSLKRKEMCIMQDIVAEVLNMERGQTSNKDHILLIYFLTLSISFLKKEKILVYFFIIFLLINLKK